MSLRGKLLKSFNKIKIWKLILLLEKKGSSLISKEKYKFEYWENILLAPFTICVRGNGNFSVRFMRH